MRAPQLSQDGLVQVWRLVRRSVRGHLNRRLNGTYIKGYVGILLFYSSRARLRSQLRHTIGP